MSAENTGYGKDMAIQVERMLTVASRLHPDFEQDCLSDPHLLVSHWQHDVTISTAEFHPDTQAGSSDETYEHETGSDDTLSGLFSQPFGSNTATITVPYQNGDHRGRWNFTLLHELGHYLQHNDPELAFRLAGISANTMSRRFEEDACNRFASYALLPDNYMRHCIGTHPTAQDVADLYDQNRDAHSLRVSRPAIIRRFANFLPKHGTVTLVNPDQKLALRAHSDWQVDYADTPEHGSLSALESEALDNIDAFNAEPQLRHLTTNALHGTHNLGDAYVSSAPSYCGKRLWYTIVVVNPRLEAGVHRAHSKHLPTSVDTTNAVEVDR